MLEYTQEKIFHPGKEFTTLQGRPLYFQTDPESFLLLSQNLPPCTFTLWEASQKMGLSLPRN